MKAQRCNYGRIVNEGVGGFLNPPTHPEHSYSVHSSYGDTFSMSLTSAAEASWLNPATRGAAKGKLKAWKPLPIEHPDVQDWIYRVMGYFKGCYAWPSDNGDINWNADKLDIDTIKDPVLLQDNHAGVHLIRKYYPEFKLTQEIVERAYWGNR
jgi:hypothetical protein